MTKGNTARSGPPDLDLLCILEALVEGESLAAGAGFFSVEEAIDDHNYRA